MPFGLRKLCQVLRFLAEKTLNERWRSGQPARGGGRGAGPGPAGVRIERGRCPDAGGAAAEATRGLLRVGRPERADADRDSQAELPASVPGGDRRAWTSRGPRSERSWVVQLADLGVGPDLAWLPQTLSSELITAFGAFSEIAITGLLKTIPTSGIDRGLDFFLAGSVRAEGTTVYLSLQLVDGQTGLQLWARVVSFDLAGRNTLPVGSWKALAEIADELADETGLIACHQMRQTATKPAAELSVREARLAFWWFTLTGMPEDLAEPANRRPLPWRPCPTVRRP